MLVPIFFSIEIYTQLVFNNTFQITGDTKKGIWRNINLAFCGGEILFYGWCSGSNLWDSLHAKPINMFAQSHCDSNLLYATYKTKLHFYKLLHNIELLSIVHL